MSGGMSGVEMDVSASKRSRWSDVDSLPEAGPSKLPGLYEMERSMSGSSSNSDYGTRKDRKGKGRAVEGDMELDVEVSHEEASNSNGNRVNGEY